MIEVMYELRILREYVLFSFFDIAWKNGWGKDRNNLGYTGGFWLIENFSPAETVFYITVLNADQGFI